METAVLQDNSVKGKSIPKVGVNIKYRRKLIGHTLKSLAESAGCSESLISKIENGKIMPSLPMLHRIAQVLDARIVDLLDEDDDLGEAVMVFRAAARGQRSADKAEGGAGSWFERILPVSRTGLLQANVLNIPAGCASENPVQHEGEEFGMVIEGAITVEIDGQRFDLARGDIIHFQSCQPHGYVNTSDATAVVLWVNTPPTL